MLSNIWAEFGDAIIIFVGCVVVGFIIDEILHRSLTARAKASGSRAYRSIAESVHWLPTSLGVVIGAFAATRTLTLTGQAAKIAEEAPQVVAILVITAFSARILGRLVRSYTGREDTPLPAGSIFVNLTRGIVWALGILSLLATLGISISPLITALGIGGLAVGLALQPTLENVFSGVQLLSSRQIKPGDFIRLETGDEGIILDVTWRNTTVHKPTNEIVIVPNSVLARASVTNFSTMDPEYVLVVPVSFASAGDPDVVERVALEVAREVIAECPEAVKDQEPGARFSDLTPPAAVLTVTIRCQSYQERIAVRHEFVRRLAKRFADEGVQAPPAPMQQMPRR